MFGLFAINFFILWIFAFINTITYKYNYKYVYLSISDSVTYLYILSSPQYTIVFLLLILFSTCIYNIKHNHIQILFYFMFVLLCFFKNYFTQNFNINSYVIYNLKQHGVNTNLQNGLLNIHPPLIYYIYSVSIYIFLLKYFKIRLESSNQESILFFLLIGGLAIYLGALWASHEFNWGSFWSWDPVEIISLIIFFYINWLYHNKKSFWYFDVKFIFMLYIALLIYSILRLGFLTSVHSFIFKNNKIIQLKWLYTLNFIFLIRLTSVYVVVYYKHTFLNVENKYVYNLYIFILCIFILSVALYSLLIFISYKISFVVINESKIRFLLLFVLVYYMFDCCIKIIFKNDLSPIIVSLSLIIVFKQLLYTHSILIYLIIFSFLFFNYKMIKRVILHNLFIIIYVIFTIYFINVNMYFYKNTNIINFISTSSFFTKCVNTLQETGFYIRKTVFFDTIKKIYKHVGGFNIYSNLFVSNYILNKNGKYNILYNHIFLYIWLFIYIILFVYTYIWYNTLEIKIYLCL